MDHCSWSLCASWSLHSGGSVIINGILQSNLFGVSVRLEHWVERVRLYFGYWPFYGKIPLFTCLWREILGCHLSFVGSFGVKVDEAGLVDDIFRLIQM